jgi:hypothetical protein
MNKRLSLLPPGTEQAQAVDLGLEVALLRGRAVIPRHYPLLAAKATQAPEFPAHLASKAQFSVTSDGDRDSRVSCR